MPQIARSANNFRILFWTGFLLFFGLNKAASASINPNTSLVCYDRYAAGILPITQDPATKAWFLLLGFDDTGFSDFGGGQKTRDKNSPYSTAIREFTEESGMETKHLQLEGLEYFSIQKKDLWYYMFLAIIPYKTVIEHSFKNADGEKSAFALFPLIDFTSTVQKMTPTENTNYIYQGYLIRTSFFYSFLPFSKTSKTLEAAMAEANPIERSVLLLYANLGLFEGSPSDPRIFPPKKDRVLFARDGSTQPEKITGSEAQPPKQPQIDKDTPEPNNLDDELKTPPTLYQRLCNRYWLFGLCTLVGIVLFFKSYYKNPFARST